MISTFKTDNKFRIFVIAIILAIILGLLTSVFFIIVDRDAYSSIYLIPDSISYTHGDANIFFEYGVKSSEMSNMDYSLDTYINDEVIANKKFSLKPGEILEERQGITLPSDMKYPSKISLKLTTKSMSDDVHFWLK